MGKGFKRFMKKHGLALGLGLGGTVVLGGTAAALAPGVSYLSNENKELRLKHGVEDPSITSSRNRASGYMKGGYSQDLQW